MAEDKILIRINEARQERSRVARRLNDFYTLALPHRPLISNQAARTQPNQDSQDDIFDQTLQQAVADYAADQIDFFTPDYKPWVKLKPGLQLSTSGERKFDEEQKKFEERLYDLIRETDFYEQQNEIFSDVAGSAGGCSIPMAQANMPVRVQPILMGSLLFDEGPFNDLDFRGQEFWAKKSDIKQMFPTAEFDRSFQSKRNDARLLVVQGNYRDWEAKGGPRWRWVLYVDGRKIVDKALPSIAPPTINIARWRNAPPSAWGPGPADLAISVARTLDELGYLNLKKLGKEADPPHSYENDGVFNPDGGIDPGTFVARRAGTKAPEPLYTAVNSQNLYFDREILQMVVKKALFQDGPFQRGDTPPTATQWIDEKAQQQRRQFARRRIYREYVLPVLKRFVYVFSARGELPPIQIDGQTIAAEFVNPLSKSSDADEVSASMQLTQSIVGMLGELGLAGIDVERTMESWKSKLDDDLLVLKAPDEQADLIKTILGEGRNIVKN